MITPKDWKNRLEEIERLDEAYGSASKRIGKTFGKKENKPQQTHKQTHNNDLPSWWKKIAYDVARAKRFMGPYVDDIVDYIKKTYSDVIADVSPQELENTVKQELPKLSTVPALGENIEYKKTVDDLMEEFNEFAAQSINEQYEINVIDVYSDEFEDMVYNIMQELVSKYRNYERAETTIPSAPDTSKFHTTVKGNIEVKKNQVIHGGHYGFTRRYVLFLKIGSGVSLDVRQQMKEEFLDEISDILGQKFEETKPIVTDDDVKYYFGTVSGSSWGGFGFWVN